MKIGMIGGGSVGQTLGAKLNEMGYDVVIGIRDVTAAELGKDRANAETLAAWAARTGGRVVTMAEAAAHGEMVFNVTSGGVSLEALHRAGAKNLAGKVLVDVANALDFSRGMPPFLIPELTLHTSVGEEIQKAFPDTHVVKAFNTIAATVMVNPGAITQDHDLLIAGNSTEAKAKVAALARDAFGWKSVVDLGDIVGARGSEHLLPLWLRMWGVNGSPNFNIRFQKG